MKNITSFVRQLMSILFSDSHQGSLPVSFQNSLKLLQVQTVIQTECQFLTDSNFAKQGL